MKLWGKIFGSFFGWLVAGPIGLFFGFLIGHLFDRGLGAQFGAWSANAKHHSAAQQAFFNATFLVMGHIAKADGRVSEAEIQSARHSMQRLGLNETQRHEAIKLFEQGKQANFDLNKALTDLIQACHANKVLLRLFLELQMQAALAEGQPSQAKQRILQAICQRLGFAPLNFMFFSDFFNFGQNQQSGQQQYQRRTYQAPNSYASLDEAYSVLGISATTTAAEIKRAYRSQMSQHHPDKLMAKGLPEEMVKLATEKTQRIQKAYETICKARGI